MGSFNFLSNLIRDPAQHHLTPQDKTNGYDFFYRQGAIKPALVGLAGPWISGGVEFNWCV